MCHDSQVFPSPIQQSVDPIREVSKPSNLVDTLIDQSLFNRLPIHPPNHLIPLPPLLAFPCLFPYLPLTEFNLAARGVVCTSSATPELTPLTLRNWAYLLGCNNSTLVSLTLFLLPPSFFVTQLFTLGSGTVNASPSQILASASTCCIRSRKNVHKKSILDSLFL